MMTEAEVIGKFEKEYLTEDDVKVILDNYTDPPQLMIVE
jgi:hypothetical protein